MVSRGILKRMKSSRADAKAFALHYLGLAPTVRNKTAVRRQAQRITTVIVDTKALTSGELTFDRAIPLVGSEKSVIETAHHALAGHEGMLVAALGVESKKSTSIKLFSGRATGSLRHQGELFAGAWIGKPTTIAHQAELTDTERERFLMQARQLAAHGSMVYAVARSYSKQAPNSFRDVSVEIVGLLLFHPQLYHGTEEAVARIREADIDIVYVSRDPEHTVLEFATLSLITNQSVVPFVYRPGRALPESAVCYASLSEKAYNQVLARFPKESTVIVDEPLPAFWRGLSSFLD